MKKLLGIFGALSLVTTGSTTAVACNTNKVSELALVEGKTDADVVAVFKSYQNYIGSDNKIIEDFLDTEAISGQSDVGITIEINKFEGTLLEELSTTGPAKIFDDLKVFFTSTKDLNIAAPANGKSGSFFTIKANKGDTSFTLFLVDAKVTASETKQSTKVQTVSKKIITIPQAEAKN